MIRTHCDDPHIHLGTGSRHGQDGGQGCHLADRGASRFPGEQIVDRAIIFDPSGNGLAGIQSRAAPHSQDEIAAVVEIKFDAFLHAFDPWVWLDTAQFHVGETGLSELFKDYLVDAVLLDAATTIGQQYLGTAMSLDGCAKNIDLSLAEVCCGWNAENKIVHV